MDQVELLIASSIKVIRDCSLPNGAIVAAPSYKDYFPKEAKNYYYVWPRDGAFICLAAQLININNIQEPFFKWCEKAEGWEETGLFYKKYHLDGKKVRMEFQPDQNGILLIALHYYLKGNKDLILKFHHLIEHSAQGLISIWDKDHFTMVTQDLWEEKFCFPDLKENFTYSLALCSKGLKCAYELINRENWLKVAEEMENVLQRLDCFGCSFGQLNDSRPDASLLGLVWPAGIIKATDPRMIKLVQMMEKSIAQNFKVHRYEQDEYDGWMHQSLLRKKRAGYWPLLNFWMAIYYLEKGDSKKAGRYFHQVLGDLKGKEFIPEQIFDNPVQVSVSPLCWSHALFIIAGKKLGLI